MIQTTQNGCLAAADDP